MGWDRELTEKERKKVRGETPLISESAYNASRIQKRSRTRPQRSHVLTGLVTGSFFPPLLDRETVESYTLLLLGYFHPQMAH